MRCCPPMGGAFQGGRERSQSAGLTAFDNHGLAPFVHEEYCMHCVCGACMLHVLVLFHGRTLPICRAVQVVQGSKQWGHCAYPITSTMSFPWLSTSITGTYTPVKTGCLPVTSPSTLGSKQGMMLKVSMCLCSLT